MHSPRIRNKLTDIFEELTNIADSTKNEKLKFYIETCIYFEKEKIKVFKDGKNGLYGYFAEETLSCCSTFDEVSQYIKEWEENKVYKIHKIFGIQKMTFLQDYAIVFLQNLIILIIQLPVWKWTQMKIFI